MRALSTILQRVHHMTSLHVARGLDRHTELEAVVGTVGGRAADILGDAGGAGQRTDCAHGDGLLFGEDADALAAGSHGSVFKEDRDDGARNLMLISSRILRIACGSRMSRLTPPMQFMP